jgi:hypothetical protein
MAGVGLVTEPGALDGMNRNNMQIFTLSRQVPCLLNPIYGWNMTADGEKLIRAGMTKMAKPDQAVMKNPEVLRGMAKDYKEAFRQNPRGVVQEGALYAFDWASNYPRSRRWFTSGRAMKTRMSRCTDVYIIGCDRGKSLSTHEPVKKVVIRYGSQPVPKQCYRSIPSSMKIALLPLLEKCT